jgi:hypothetical protein
MLDTMRKPIFIVALIVIFLTVLVELGSMAVLHVPSQAGSPLDVAPNGKAIPALAFLDGLVFFATMMIGIALFLSQRFQSKIQGIITLVFSLLLTLGCIGVVIADFVLLMLMVGLLLSVPFGTIVYFAVWSGFDTTNARLVLSLLMTLKIIFAVCLVLAEQRFLQNKGLMLIIATSLVSNLIIAFLHGFVPRPLVSITDDLAAIVVCILAIIWAVVYLIGGIVSVVKVIV